ncbi:HAMP domain-containing sensor histidine kinase [Eubacteriaceae bacterium ES2]|nr:HAMP domain-containing sensor histidine kinase [Eubacteriaceae bacterium ES2]
MEIKKTISIFRLFLEHLVGFSAAVIAIIIAAIIAASMAFQSGLILQANATEMKLNQLEQAIKTSFDEDELPVHSKYIIIDSNGSVIESDMSDQELKKTKVALSTGQKAYYDFYKEIAQDNGNIVIIKYDMLAHFSNPTLHKIIPNPELMFILLLLAVIVLLAILTALKFSRKLRRNLIPINLATEKIETQDLDFEVKPTEITEFNSSLYAIDKLKTALADSLSSQWHEEEQRKLQLSALAHDIKTPLTIIKGNVELLLEEASTQENKELLDYIMTGSNTIEKYLELLMGVVINEPLLFYKERIRLNDFMNDITIEVLPLCKRKNISLNFQNDSKSSCLLIDRELIKRAIINIFDNAVRYAPQDSRIDFKISDNERQLIFEIIDCGKGFSEESLKRASQEFFSEDSSRKNQHYGLGLSFVKKVVEMHDGRLKIENRSDRQGAKVSFSLAKN